MVRALASSGHGVEIVRAAAGTGKTSALEAARTAGEAEGLRVYGCALSARAATELQEQTGIDATTIARLRLDLDRGYGLPSGGVLVVDEAGIVGSRQLAELAEQAAAHSTKLVLMGDDRQLPELEAGGAFAGPARRLGGHELHQVRRQRFPTGSPRGVACRPQSEVVRGHPPTPSPVQAPPRVGGADRGNPRARTGRPRGRSCACEAGAGPARLGAVGAAGPDRRGSHLRRAPDHAQRGEPAGEAIEHAPIPLPRRPWSRDDVRVGAAKVPVLRARTSRRARAAATVPAGTGAARYRLLACADDTRKVRERNERNNCRAARRALTVVARTPAGGVRSPAPWT